MDAMPEQAGKNCLYRFTAPMGTATMQVNAKVPVQAYANGEELPALGNNEFSVQAKRAVQITLQAQQNAGEYDTALFTLPVTFHTEIGEYDTSISPDLQGLSFYSGGISLKKTLTVDLARTSSRIFFRADPRIGCAFEVYVNEQPVATLLTSPYRCEITDYLRDGDNLIEVRAYNTLHNHMKTIPTQYNNTFKPFMKD
jgi:hypothetical protein